MNISIQAELDYTLAGPSDLLLQIEAAALPDQAILDQQLSISGEGSLKRVAGEENIGERIWLQRDERLTATYSAKVAIHRPDVNLADLEQTAPHDLPGDVIKYLMGSRYCDVGKFQTFVNAEFGGLSGGARVLAMRDWIEAHFSYVPGSSNSETTAVDTFVARQGICRDYAHVMVAFARAVAIPARVASVYAVDVEPPDFHAVAEVYVGRNWHLIDPTGMAPVGGIARIGVGRDAADVSFMTIYGAATLQNQSVSVTRG